MALNKEILQNKLIEAFNQPNTVNNVEKVATAIATAVDEYIRQAVVTGVCPSSGGALVNGKII